MRSSRPISLFYEPPKESRRPSAFLVSFLVHCTVVIVVIYGFLFAPRINMNAAADRYVLRDVELNRPDPERKPPLANSGLYPGARPAEQTNTPHGSLAAPPSSLRQLERKLLADRTLIQPDTKINKLLLKTTPVPSLLLWAQKPKVQLITPPVQQRPVTAQVRPSIELPNQEVNLADIAISSTAYVKTTVMPVPSNTSPIAVHGLEQTQTVPETSSISSDQASSIAVMSLSEFRLSQGRVVLPPANQTAPGTPSGALAPGTSGNSSQAGKGDPSSRGLDADARSGQGTPGNPSGPAPGHSGVGSGKAGANSAQGGGAPGGEGGGAPSFTRVNLPHDGKFNVVVVGSALVEQFPKTGEFWGDRLVYSVYLHVGLAKNWILQYSLPSSADPADAGGVTHLEAPWPYYIVRPDVNPGDVGADALMIHGFVNKAGRFESLGLSFPPRFPKGQLILDELAQWQFRPATLNGQNARAEVLLIIPDED